MRNNETWLENELGFTMIISTIKWFLKNIAISSNACVNANIYRIDDLDYLEFRIGYLLFRIYFFFLWSWPLSWLIYFQGSSHYKVRWLERSGRGILSCGLYNTQLPAGIWIVQYIIPSWFSFTSLRLRNMFRHGQSQGVNVIVANIYIYIYIYTHIFIDFQNYHSWVYDLFLKYIYIYIYIYIY